MKNITSVILISLLSSLAPVTSATELSNTETPKLVIVTIDGLRWQEAFGGADEKLLNNKDFVNNVEALSDRFWHPDKQERKNRLMPFLTNEIGKNGVLIGDRNNQSTMSLTNNQHFSFPGYNEIFTGKVDDNLTSNAKVLNPNVTFLEWLNKQASFENQIAIFSGWDVFPFIYNRERSGLFINAGFEDMPSIQTTPKTSQDKHTANKIHVCYTHLTLHKTYQEEISDDL